MFSEFWSINSKVWFMAVPYSWFVTNPEEMTPSHLQIHQPLEPLTKKTRLFKASVFSPWRYATCECFTSLDANSLQNHLISHLLPRKRTFWTVQNGVPWAPKRVFFGGLKFPDSSPPTVQLFQGKLRFERLPQGFASLVVAQSTQWDASLFHPSPTPTPRLPKNNIKSNHLPTISTSMAAGQPSPVLGTLMSLKKLHVKLQCFALILSLCLIPGSNSSWQLLRLPKRDEVYQPSLGGVKIKRKTRG